MTSNATPNATPSAYATLLLPLREPVFRMFTLAWLAGNMTMWMNDVSASWLMASLTEGPMMVALVQASASLPLFLLGLPSGALADMLNRKRLYAFAQFWIALVAAVLAAMAAMGWMTPHSLLLLCFANGIGLALRFPVFSAIIPTLMPRDQLPAALTINALAINLSRIVGPLLAGVVIASLGMSAIFILNAAMSLLSCALILRCALPAQAPASGGQGLLDSMRDGLAFVRQSLPMRSILWRAFCFFVHSVGLIALLPLLAKGLKADATTYTVLLASMGFGAILAALILPRISGAHVRNRVVAIGTLLYAAAVVTAALAPTIWLAAPALSLAGAVWMSVVTNLTMAVQLVLPNRLRARGIAIYQMSIMGGSAFGAALWGQVASHSSVTHALLASAGASLIVLWLSRHVSVQHDAPDMPAVAPAPAMGAAMPTTP